MRLCFSFTALMVGLGAVLVSSGEARANCLHGLLHCGYCGTGYGYVNSLTSQPVTGVPMVNAMVDPGLSVRPPSFVPMLSYAGAGMASNTPSIPASPVLAAPQFVVWHPTVYSHPMYPHSAMSCVPSWLQGYDPNAPIVSVPPGTSLTHGHLFGSHIFGLLQRFGSTLNRPQLLDLASKLFSDAAGYLPGGNDVAILGQIVDRFLRSRGSPGPDPDGGTDGGGGAAGREITIVITVKAPENVRVKVDGAEAQNAAAAGQKDASQPRPGRPTGDDHSQTSDPPPRLPAATSKPK